LNHALTFDQREEAIKSAKEFFNHNNTENHDNEVTEGAANSLCLQLGYALNIKNKEHGILYSIFSSLELVYRCTLGVRRASFDRIGMELIPLLIKSIEICEKDAENNGSVLKIIKIMNLLSEIDSASNYMASTRVVVTALLVGLQKQAEQQVKFETISTFKNISYFAEEHRIQLVQEPLFIPYIAELSFLSTSNSIRELISETLRNLALAQDTKIPMAQQGVLLNVIIHQTEYNSERIKLNAVITLGSLAIPVENNYWLISHSEGAIIGAIIRLMNDNDSNIQERALKVLKRISRGDNVLFLIDYSNLLNTLSSLACSEYSTNIRVDAVEIISSLLPYLDEQSCSSIVKLVRIMINLLINNNHNQKCLEIIFHSLLKVSSSPTISALMVLDTEILQVLTSDLVSDPEIALLVFKMIFNIVSCQSKELRNTIMSSSRVLSMLVDFVNLYKEGQHRRNISNLAASILVLLSQDEMNRSHLAQHEGLILALVQFVTNTSVEISVKNEVKNIIVQLVPLT